MTVINPKSISGINSITTGSGSDDILTIHNNNGTERLRVDNTGATKITTGIVTTLTATTGIVTTLTTNTLTANSTAKVGSGVTLSPDGDVFATGVCTATSFVGDGSGLTNPGPSLTGSTNNTIVTVTGANAIQGESNLTFDGNELSISHTNPQFRLIDTTNNTDAYLFSDDNGSIRLAADLNNEASDSRIRMSTDGTERVSIAEDLTISDGNLVIGTSGHGIDFSATSGSGTSELFDDYEEGTFSPGFSGDSGGGSYGYSKQVGTYTKIGNTVHFQLYLQTNAVNANASGNTLITGLPFTSISGDGGYTGVSIGYYASWNGVVVSQALVDTSSTRMYIYKNNTTTGVTYSYPGDIVASSSIIIGGQYFAA